VLFVTAEVAEPEAAAAEGDAAATAASAAAAEEAAAAEPEEDERAIVFKLYELLRAADMEVRSTQHNSMRLCSTAACIPRLCFQQLRTSVDHQDVTAVFVQQQQQHGFLQVTYST
jgi:hypothetical protein